MSDITLKNPVAVPHKYRNRFLRDSASVSRSTSSSGGNGSSVDLSAYLKRSVFEELFEKVTLEDGSVYIRAKYGLASDDFLTAHGYTEDGGSSGVSSFAELTEVKGTSPEVNQVWGVTAIAEDGTVSYGWLTQSGGGGTTYESGVGINIVGSTINAYTKPNQDALDPNDNRVYYICVDTSGYLAVKVPWTSGEGGDTYTAGDYITIDSSNAINVNLQAIEDTNTFAIRSHTHDLADINELEDALSDKQDVISDLATIRSKADNGQTAYTTIQNSNFATQDWVEDKDYLTAVAYDDLTTKPTQSELTDIIGSYYAAYSHTHSQYLTSATFSNKTISLWGNTVLIDGGSATGSMAVSGDVVANSFKAHSVCIESDSSGVYSNSYDGEINRFSSELHLQYSSYGNLSLCMGGGNVGVGIRDAQYKLHVNGDFCIGDANNGVIMTYDSSNHLLVLSDISGNPLNLVTTGALTAHGLQSTAEIATLEALSVTTLGVTTIASSTDSSKVASNAINVNAKELNVNTDIYLSGSIKVGNVLIGDSGDYLDIDTSTYIEGSIFVGDDASNYEVQEIYADGSYLYMKINGKTYKLQPIVTPY